MIARFVLWMMLLAALLFWPAGTLDWPGAWVFLSEFVIVTFAIGLWLAQHNPDLLKERMRGRVFGKGQVFWDKIYMAFMTIAWCAWIVLMALDAKRWAVSYVPNELVGTGAVLLLVGFFIVWLTFRENSFASPVIKIQEERKQTVVTTGPYRIVRHPMYVGASIYMIGIPLLLGSWLGFACLPLLIGALVLRIYIEEDTLRKGLPGYVEYTERVRYRLVPYVW